MTSKSVDIPSWNFRFSFSTASRESATASRDARSASLLWRRASLATKTPLEIWRTSSASLMRAWAYTALLCSTEPRAASLESGSS
jgi:hypothetical protein